MKIMIVGSGGREHALAWKIAQSPLVDEIVSFPGNPGMARYGPRLMGDPEDPQAILESARATRAELVVIGPEAPLVAGAVDLLETAGIAAFGPRAAQSQLEGSKIFAKQIMAEAGVPTSAFECFDDPAEAMAYVAAKRAPVAVKADGLAAGKGVVVCDSPQEAEEAIRSLMVEMRVGAAGKRVVIEDKLEGREASLLALCDGQTLLPLAAAQDHKRAHDGDRGPNTGGMGAYSPTPVVTPECHRRVVGEILEPIVQTLAKKDMPFKGVLYAGVMVGEEGPKVLEFNVRFGDPETQAILPRMASDLVPLIKACVDGNLARQSVEWIDGGALCVVMASGGYPGPYEKGREITGLDEAERVKNVAVFQAGTREKEGRLVTQGGRVLGVTGLGETLREAKESAYQAVDKIHWEGCFYRRDIGWQALMERD